MQAGIIFLTVLVVVYIGSYVLNKRTEAPIDVKISAEKCGACTNFSCAIKQNTVEEK